MSTNVKAANVEVVPFFARFLAEQASDQPETPSNPPNPNPFPFPYTLKYPSDWEDQ